MNPERLQHLLTAATRQRLLVVGDAMLDRFLWGRVSRISPEAPVPVVEVTTESCYPGGAANVARNLRRFCGGVELASAVGNDAHGSELRRLLKEEGIGTDLLFENPSSPTTVKTRIIARQQQVVRVDREKPGPLQGDLLAKITAALVEALPRFDGVVLEDYGKGFMVQALINEVLREAGRLGKVTAVDPNPRNLLAWDGATVVKPNRSEAFAAAKMPDPGAEENPLEDTALLRVGPALLDLWKSEQLLITLGEHGMILFEKDSPPYHTPTRAREVFDVSGAGDTAIALYTLALCAGASPTEAAEISNHASGVVVGKLGTATLGPEELNASFENHAA